MRKKRVVIGHPGMGFGGSEACVMNILESLQDTHNITLVTTNNIDIETLNNFYNTSVELNKITIRSIPIPYFMKNNLKYAGLRGAFYARFCKKIGKNYDLAISAYNLTDWGMTKQIHFIADFSWDRALVSSFGEITHTRLIHKDNLLRRLYLTTCQLIRGKIRSYKEMINHDTIVANSQWSSNILSQNYNKATQYVIYPPVKCSFADAEYLQRKVEFVSLGRIELEKRLEEQIWIMDELQKQGYNLTLHIIGNCGNDSYGEQIRSLGKNKPYIKFEGRQSGKAKEQLLTSCRFALHTRTHEAFGITVAEFVKAGCIPFIPNNGGQTEILPITELQFNSKEEAVEKIIQLLENPSRHEKLYNEIKTLADNFYPERFKEESLIIINKELEGDK